MKIGVICDMHMGENAQGIQTAFLLRAVAQMKKDGAEKVLNLGDITAFGELSAFENYMEALQPFEHFFVLGNSDVRCEKHAIPSCHAVSIRIFRRKDAPLWDISATAP